MTAEDHADATVNRDLVCACIAGAHAHDSFGFQMIGSSQSPCRMIANETLHLGSDEHALSAAAVLYKAMKECALLGVSSRYLVLSN